MCHTTFNWNDSLYYFKDCLRGIMCAWTNRKAQLRSSLDSSMSQAQHFLIKEIIYSASLGEWQTYFCSLHVVVALTAFESGTVPCIITTVYKMTAHHLNVLFHFYISVCWYSVKTKSVKIVQEYMEHLQKICICTTTVNFFYFLFSAIF